jgi:hypothetical protein
MIRLKNIITRFERNKNTIVSLYNGVTQKQAIWKPSSTKWSLLEVINHLIDEEKEDFRKRLDHTLHKQGEPWPGIDPPAWIIEHKYNKRDLKQSVQLFQQERQNSTEWFSSIKTPDFESFYDHPIFGKIRAGDLLTSWLAHDLLHIKQIAMLKAQYLEYEFRPFNISYALPQS